MAPRNPPLPPLGRIWVGHHEAGHSALGEAAPWRRSVTLSETGISLETNRCAILRGRKITSCYMMTDTLIEMKFPGRERQCDVDIYGHGRKSFSPQADPLPAEAISTRHQDKELSGSICTKHPGKEGPSAVLCILIKLLAIK